MYSDLEELFIFQMRVVELFVLLELLLQLLVLHSQVVDHAAVFVCAARLRPQAQHARLHR